MLSNPIVVLGVVGVVLLAAASCWGWSSLVVAARADRRRRKLRAVPPSRRRDRWRTRLTLCAADGHTMRLAIPLGRVAQQCVECGAIAPPVVIRSYRVPRWSAHS